jgi:2-polyprenyl-3-methyl-5-hydroxy-6-metoxy-1,4-benzoquinol methylase
MEKHVLTLETSLSPEALRDRLKKWEPWSIRVDFNNGVSTKEFVRRIPFSEQPLFKFSIAERAIPFSELRGGRLLDIGCNSGYNSVHAASKYRFSCLGVDVVPRHIEVSRFFSELAEIDSEFLIGSAETFSRPNEFDVVLHFGTLYHLKNPLLSLQASFENLKPGGYFALETQVYDHPEDPNICYFMHMQNNDKTNFWALSTSVLTKCLQLQGFSEIQELLKVVPAILAPHMSRLILVARKPEIT